jgi:hypothetical protein
MSQKIQIEMLRSVEIIPGFSAKKGEKPSTDRKLADRLVREGKAKLITTTSKAKD